MEKIYELRWERPAALYLAAQQVAKEKGMDVKEVLIKARSLPGWIGGAAFMLLNGTDVLYHVEKGLEAGARPGRERVEEALEVLRRSVG